MPPFEELHPAVVHFPIALLMILPLIILAATIFKKHRGGLHVAALIILIAATASAALAQETGEEAEHKAEDQVEGNAVADELLHEHEELGEKIALLSFILLALYGGGLSYACWQPRAAEKGKKLPALDGNKAMALSLIMVLASGGLAGMVGYTGKLGGELVHDHGVTAKASTGDSQTSHGGENEDHD